MESEVLPYPWRIKDGAHQYMFKVLKYGGTIDRRMDGQICRITHTGYTIEATIGFHYQKELANDHVYQVAVLGIEDREFIVLQSLLEPLKGETVYTDKAGNVLYQD